MRITSSRLLAFFLVSLVIFFLYIPINFIFLSKLKSVYTFMYIIFEILLTFGVIMIFITYFFAVFSDPGYNLPDDLELTNNEDFAKIKLNTENVKARITSCRKRIKKIKKNKNSPDIENFQNTSKEQLENEINELYFNQLEKRTYCFKCENIKEIRTHHCKICNKCIRRMDHHCPWTGNCVGEDNIGYFIQFLFWASTTILFFYILEFFFYIFGGVNFGEEIERVFMIFNWVMGMLIGSAIFYLFHYQVKNTKINITTVEDFIKDAAKKKPFDKGWKKNLNEIFGKNYSLLNILFPIRPNRNRLDNSF